MVYLEPEAYSEPQYIHKPGIFKNPVYSEPWHIQNPVKHLRLSVLQK